MERRLNLLYHMRGRRCWGAHEHAGLGWGVQRAVLDQALLQQLRKDGQGQVFLHAIWHGLDKNVRPCIDSRKVCVAAAVLSGTCADQSNEGGPWGKQDSYFSLMDARTRVRRVGCLAAGSQTPLAAFHTCM